MKSDGLKLCGFLFCVSAGYALLILCGLGVVVMAIPANVFSSQHTISNNLFFLLFNSQYVFGWLLVVCSPLFFGITFISKCLRKVQKSEFEPMSVTITLLTLVVSFFIQDIFFDHIPHVTDAISHIFQAKIFCLGRLYAPVPFCYKAFYQYNIYMTESGKWFAIYPPGHALTLAAFLKAGLLVISGPLLHACTIFAFMWLVRRFYNATTSLLCGTLSMLSPLLLLLSASYMSHLSFGFYSMIGIALYVAGIDRWRLNQYLHAFVVLFLAGLAIGMSILTRPQDSLLVAITALACLPIIPIKLYRDMLVCTIFFIVGAILPGLFQLYWNHVFYGAALTLGYGRSIVGNMVPLCVPTFGFSETFTAVTAAKQFLWVSLKYNKVLLGWPTSLIFIPCCLLHKSKKARYDLICVFNMALVFGFYYFYSYYGQEYECRFYALAAFCSIVLVARGIQLFSAWLSANRFFSPGNAQAFVGIIVLIFILYSFIYYWPTYLYPIYSTSYEQASVSVARKVNEAKLNNAIVLLPSDDKYTFFYSSGFMLNDPLLEGPVIYARNDAMQYSCLKKVYSNRFFYVFTETNEVGLSLLPLDIK
ncbi:MAG: hypothetical protein EOM12_09190 [Verrucomicrobiae bacterium]|nr:hypothetical protein [Verrucomicrobiae bacterium]